MKTYTKVLLVLLVIIAVFFFFSQKTDDKSVKNKPNIQTQSKLSLIKADEDFYKASLVKGTGRAFIEFADSDVVIMRQNSKPLFGIEALRQSYFNVDTVQTTLRWNPVKAEVSPDGKLGYTFGNWSYETIDRTGRITKSDGNYITIWRKQKDGTWKYVFDGGSNSPSQN